MPNSITRIPIPSILLIRNGAIGQLEENLMKQGFTNALIIFDDFIFETFKTQIEERIISLKIDYFLLPPDLDIQQLIKLAFSFNHYDVVLTVGGGSTIDCGKYIAHSSNGPFISIPTSASNDGFASSNCSLIVEGKKTTVPAPDHGRNLHRNKRQQFPNQRFRTSNFSCTR